MDTLTESNGQLFPLLNDLFQRLDTQWDEGLSKVLQCLVEANRLGHVCLPIPDPLERERLCCSSIIGRAGEYTPLILDETNCLYFARDWYDEVRLATRFSRMAQASFDVGNEKNVRKWLERLFPYQNGVPMEQQKLAAALALRQQLLVISGGPGTGKTTTVVRLLALLQGLSRTNLAIAMAAPTGKAAARLTESVMQIRTELAIDKEVSERIPSQAVTLHRLLGWQPGKSSAFYNASKLLPLDVLVIDEASMVDQHTLCRIVEALPAGCRLILLGDHEQLASVGKGAVFGELCTQLGYRPATLRWLSTLCDGPLDLPLSQHTSLVDCVVLLTHNYRFDKHGGIAKLASYVNAGQVTKAFDVLHDATCQNVGWVCGDLTCYSLEKRKAYLEAVRAGQGLEEIYNQFLGFMVLAVEREEVFAINSAYEAQLETKGWKKRGQDWYAGRPVMITENNYNLGLYNGDIGFTVEQEGKLVVAFPNPDKGWRAIAPHRLPAHETVFAMTVHKSQGSEYGEVWLILPKKTSQVLSRSLIYTAITRAKKNFYVAGRASILEQGIQHDSKRNSGLALRWRDDVRYL